MPTLNWMGKEKVVNHHREVPYRVLTRVPEKGVLDSAGSDHGNMIIHGDNLEALKALLPEYEGKVDCIYIDPPYNTGNEGWVYNDNVNDPRIKKWLGEVVGKDGEDFSRHDKWLCMMYPRLQLLHKLLKPQGALFVSIDENEICNLRMILDEIFGASNFVQQITLLCNPKGRSQDKYFASCHEYVVVYSKGLRVAGSFSVEKDDGDISDNYRMRDEHGWYRTLELRNTHREFNRDNRPNLYYPIYLSDDGKSASLTRDESHQNEALPLWPDGYQGCWTWSKEKSRAQIDDLVGKKQPTGWKVYRKDYAHKEGGVTKKKLFSIWTNPDFYTEKGQIAFGEIFPGANKNDFPQPKSVELVKEAIRCATPKDGVVLDSFAGSGTTAQAVLSANDNDGGSRQFILVEREGYADSTTAERIRRVIAGYPASRIHRTRLFEKKLTLGNLKKAEEYIEEALAIKDGAIRKYNKVEGPKLDGSYIVVDGVSSIGEAVPGIDSGFSYYELGPALFDEDGAIDPAVTYVDLARYVWATETRAPYEDLTAEHPYLLGEHAGAVYYLAWEPGEETALTYDLLRGLPRKGSPTVIYADRCAVAPGRLDEMGVVFKRVPDQIARI
ncbi:site-specific DNA-methyltransferase [Collinsella ihumii]|uniref:Site-specific DNA-methyltransferase n=1 Tax=Collinsella ihumii TaxID=1720204 RepID=A0AAW7JNN9_9ACTN|nr:site-specific DNA-methyltransferase [Collinsella ihumii]MDN0069148.1 site-specific DNA-methyltransferase [Collinsella ihumii]